MSFVVDTDICSAYLKGDGRVFNRFIQRSGAIHISILTVAELYSWVYVAREPARREAGLLEMLSDLKVLPVSGSEARRFGEVRAELARDGKRVATVDLLIAVTALVHDFTVITHNRRHFGLVPGLRVEDWLTS
jgi:tRNA(fMet)-specific endonuclease VapC